MKKNFVFLMLFMLMSFSAQARTAYAYYKCVGAGDMNRWFQMDVVDRSESVRKKEWQKIVQQAQKDNLTCYSTMASDHFCTSVGDTEGYEHAYGTGQCYEQDLGKVATFTYDTWF